MIETLWARAEGEPDRCHRSLLGLPPLCRLVTSYFRSLDELHGCARKGWSPSAKVVGECVAVVSTLTLSRRSSLNDPTSRSTTTHETRRRPFEASRAPSTRHTSRFRTPQSSRASTRPALLRRVAPSCVPGSHE